MGVPYIHSPSHEVPQKSKIKIKIKIKKFEKLDGAGARAMVGG
jgi:hypothetical protein